MLERLQMAAQKMPVIVDSNSIDKMCESHLGTNYTLIILKNHERITLNIPLRECRARFYRAEFSDYDE